MSDDDCLLHAAALAQVTPLRMYPAIVGGRRREFASAADAAAYTTAYCGFPLEPIGALPGMPAHLGFVDAEADEDERDEARRYAREEAAERRDELREIWR